MAAHWGDLFTLARDEEPLVWSGSGGSPRLRLDQAEQLAAAR